MVNINISKRAKKTLRLIEQGRLYRAFDRNNPATIKELEDAGLIRRAARPMVLVSAYVPVIGYQAYLPERFTGESFVED